MACTASPIYVCSNVDAWAGHLKLTSHHLQAGCILLQVPMTVYALFLLFLLIFCSVYVSLGIYITVISFSSCFARVK